MAVMMLMTAWVFVAPEHDHASAVSAATIAGENAVALNSIGSFNTDVTTITDLNWAYNGDNQDNEPNIYKNILYASDCNVVTANTGSVNLKDNGAATIQWYHGTYIFLYDGVTTPQAGVMVAMIPKNSSHNIRMYSSYIASGAGLNLAHNWYASDGRANFMWVISAPGNMNAATKDGSINSTYCWTVNSNTWFANKLQFTDSMSNNEYYRDIKVRWGWKGNQKSQGTGSVYTYEADAVNHVYVVNYVPLKDALNEALGTGTYGISTLKNNAAKYTTASIKEYVAAVKDLIAAKPNNYVNVSKNDYMGYANAASAAVTRFNNAKAGLKLQQYNLKFTDVNGKVVHDQNYNYGASVDCGAIARNNPNTIKQYDDQYHQIYRWDESKFVTSITDDISINEILSTSEGHNFATPVKKDDTFHTTTCTVCNYVKEINHQWNDGVVTTEPDCLNAGVKTFTCAGCGATITEPVAALGHSFTSGIYAEKEAGENGTHYQKCIRCDVYGWGVTEGNCEAHKWVEESRVNAECEKDGSITYKCSVCGSTSYVKTITQTGHQKVRAVAAKDVSKVCGEIGWPAFWICDDCGKAWLDAEKTQAIENPADNDSNGVPDSIEIKNSHVFNGDWVSASTGKDGEHYRACSICNKAYGLDGVEGAKEAHDWNDGTVTTPATCTKEGVKTFKCELCPQTYTETIAKADHKMTKTEEKAADCLNPGNNAYYYCSECKKYYKDEAGTTETTVSAETIKAFGHTFAEGNTDEEHPESDGKVSAATCQAAAVYRVTCDRCNAVSDLTYSYGTPDTENGHDFSGEIRKNDDGTHSYKCTVPGCPEYGNATACEFTVPVADVASTCHTYGYTITKCATCGKENRVEKTTLDFTNHDGATELRGQYDATCATNGFTGNTYCLGCGTKIADGETIPADKTKYPHENMVDYAGKEATCQVEGYTAYTYCDKCGTYAVEKVTIDKKTHKFTNYYTNNNGTHTAVCDTCKAENGEIATDTEDCSGGTANCVDKKVCTVCNTAYGDVDVNSHKTVVTIAKVPATCQTEGTQAYRFCEACDKALEEIVKIEKVAHSYSAWAKVDGEDKHERYCTTCDTDVAPAVTQTEDCYGGTAYCNALAKCATCKAEYGQLDPSNHSTESNHLVGAYDATCQAPGYTGDYHYDCCDVLKEEGKEIAQLEHTFDIEVEGTRVDATCIAKGEVTFKCSTCKEEGELKAATQKKELNIDSKNHASEETVTVGEKAATCESDGNTGDIYHKCCYDANKTEAENRKALISKGTVIKANGQHIYGAAVPEYMIKEIKETKDENDKVIKREFVLEEAPDYDAKIAARHEDGKWYHFEICTVCHEVVSSACYTYEHTYNCVETDECEVCSGLCSLIDENKHKADLVEVTEGAKAATCVSNGVKSYYKCADCDKTFFDEAGKKPFDPENEEHQAALVIDKSTVGHTIDWETPDVEVEGNCGTSGYKLYKCSVTGCDYETTVNTGVASNKHTWKTEYDVIKEATCGTNGYQAIKCEVCGATKSNSTVIVPATEEHDFDKNKDGVVDRNDAAITEGIDCQTPGTLTYTCQVCEATKVETDTEGVSAHTWGEWVTKGGDCSTGILQERTCSVCNATEQQRITTDTHQFELYIEVLPTAQKDGYRIERCANCGIEERTELPYDASGEGGEGGETPDTPDTPETDKHVVDENIYTVHEKADCRHGEIRRYTCLLCGEMVEREVGEPTEHIWMTQTAEIATCTRPGHSEYKRCLICLKEDGRENYEQLKHTDGDGNGKCDYCNSAFYDDGEGSKTCGCICHKENFFMQIIYKIISFFWRLFKIGHSCDCGAVHY